MFCPPRPVPPVPFMGLGDRLKASNNTCTCVNLVCSFFVYLTRESCPIESRCIDISCLTLANCNSHLSRRAYGFRESEAWRDDKRELEAALWEIDQLERQTEYQYQRPSLNRPWTAGRSPTWGPFDAHYHHVQITRSNSDFYSNSESEMSSFAGQSYGRYDDDSEAFGEYQRGYGTCPSMYGVPSVFHRYPGSQSSQHYQNPYYMLSPRPRSSNSDYEDFRDSMDSPNHHHQHHDIVPSRTSSYASSHYSSEHPDSQLQMVTRRGGQNESPSPERTPAPLSNIMSPPWSMEATEGTATARSEYSDYVESYDDDEESVMSGYYDETSGCYDGSSEEEFSEGSDDFYYEDSE